MEEFPFMKNYFRISIALCIGILVGSATNAFAAVGDVIEAQFSKFVFKVDGQEKTLESDPLVYQGTTYLPVRVIANLLGKDVVYKADLRTIEINTPVDVKREGGTSVADFRSYSPELINNQITAMEAGLKTETNPDVINMLQIAIDERKSYLEQIGWEYEAPSSDLELQLIEVNRKIEVTLDSLETAKQHEELQDHPSIKNLEKTLEELNAEKAKLESQLQEQSVR